MLFPSSILHFWFSELAPKNWFAVNPAVDATVRARFLDLYRALKAAPPDGAALDAHGHLAAVIVFDQFPRNLFRGTAEAFATDALALSLSHDAVARGLDAGLSMHERQFLYMPHMHCEDPAVQERSVALFESLGFPEAFVSALQHKEAIDRFGRFPYRNRALGRVSSAEEEVFLKTHPSP